MARNNSTEEGSGPAGNRFWPRSTSLFLLLVGLTLAVLSFVVVINMPELPWHPGHDTQLRATYDHYRDTGELAPTTGDDDPGAAVLASLMGRLTGSDSPYPGLALAQALLVALPLVWLPTAVARIFRRARAGYAMVLLPPVVWLVNNGTILVGTEYGLSDEVSTLRVPALYGIPASMTFLILSLLLLFSTHRLTVPRLFAISGLVVVLGGLTSLFDSVAGVGVAAAVAVLWWINPPARWRFSRAALAGVLSVGLTVAAHGGLVTVLNDAGADGASPDRAQLPVSAEPWQGIYVGLSYPEPITGATPDFDVPSSVEGIRERLEETRPDAAPGSVAYQDALRDLVVGAVSADPARAFSLYLHKTLFVVKHFGAMIVLILVGFVLALTRRAPQRRAIAAAFAIAVPTLVLGLATPVLRLPVLYDYSQLSAALGLLSAVSLGAIVWSITSMPSHVRSVERNRVSARVDRTPGLRRPFSSAHGPRLSVVVPTRNGAEVLESTLDALGAELTAADEIIVVENGSTDGTPELLVRIRDRWTHPSTLVLQTSDPGLGEALRAGVLASTGRRLLLTADDLPFGFTDLVEFRKLPDDAAVAVGSKAHPGSAVARGRLRTVQSRIFRFLRQALLQSEVGDSQGTLWVDGEWGRQFARLSRESGLMWTTELVLAAEQQGIAVREVPVALSVRHETGSSRFRFSDAWQSVLGFTRLAVYKDDYCNEDWARSTRPSADTSERRDDEGLVR